MTKQEYYKDVALKVQKQIWDVEMNQAFNLRQIEELEHDIGKAETVVLTPGKDQRDGVKTIGGMKQELHARHRKDEAFGFELERLQEQLDFIEGWREQAE